MKDSKKIEAGKVFYPVERSVQFKEKGILFESPHHMNGKGLPNHLEGIKRGKMKGFSKASKKRMREAIIGVGCPDGMVPYAVTLTVPGEKLLSPEESKRLWRAARDQFNKLGYCGFWRIEIQERGMVHWHLLLCAPVHSEYKIRQTWFKLLNTLPKIMVPVTEYQAKYLDTIYDGMVDLSKWEDALWVAESMQHEGYSTRYKDRNTSKNFIVLPLRRSEVAGANVKACDVECRKVGVGWLRYINDHCTKAKQAQVVGWGGVRHWGFINKKLLPESESKDIPVSFPESVQLLRILSKWARPRIKADCVFGCRLGFRTSRGRTGSSVWFGEPEFYEKALLYSQSHPAEPKFGLRDVRAYAAPERTTPKGLGSLAPLPKRRIQACIDKIIKPTPYKLLPATAEDGATRIPADSILWGE